MTNRPLARIEVAGLAGLHGGAVGGEDDGAIGVVEGQPLGMRLEEAPAGAGVCVTPPGWRRWRARRRAGGQMCDMVTRELDAGGAAVQADQILESKGRLVESIRPEATVRAAVDALQAANVGALVVSPDGRALAGIISERDVVRRLAADGADLLDAPVSSIMQPWCTRARAPSRSTT